MGTKNYNDYGQFIQMWTFFALLLLTINAQIKEEDLQNKSDIELTDDLLKAGEIEPIPEVIANACPGRFACKTGNKCIPREWSCDGEQDCPDGSDEFADCPVRTCPPDKFKCTLTAHCLPLGNVCDGESGKKLIFIGIMSKNAKIFPLKKFKFEEKWLNLIKFKQTLIMFFFSLGF